MIDLESDHPAGAIDETFLQPFERPILLSEPDINKCEIPGGNSPPLGHFRQLREKLKRVAASPGHGIRVRQIRGEHGKRWSVWLDTLETLLKLDDGQVRVSLLIVGKSHNAVGNGSVHLQHFSALLEGLIISSRVEKDVCEYGVLERVKLNSPPCFHSAFIQPSHFV